ncbi:lysozyme inhibitor LprI family protein [Salipaludibacillus sp. HK11]|uniref:lysozyme inhibitor LprI family protein n=1 Tax=Salipaludibacillus sp. HK11 TaxID=3394320 RepID=UPI0039FCD2E9
MSKLVVTFLIALCLVGCNQGTTYISEQNSKAEKIAEKVEIETDMKESFTELEEVTENGNLLDLKVAQGEILARWDNILNEIYAVLENQLGEEEMDKLREEQREWVSYRDEQAEKNALKYEGGSMEPVEYISTQSHITKERSYQ